MLKIADEGHPYKGAGAWGEATTLEAARKIARKELRATFGKVKATVETRA